MPHRVRDIKGGLTGHTPEGRKHVPQTVHVERAQDQEVRFVLTLYGLSWKLSNIAIPPALLGSAG